MGSVVHPDLAAVHDLFCRELMLHGVCECFIQDGLDGGPYLMVRVKPDRQPVLVALRNIEELIPPRQEHESRR
ncbi:MAG: hypothetical protein NZR01_11560 [Bryobacteraceae bacterium]|nr:hypothetical protein [Bryobacteraceae bacterium]